MTGDHHATFDAVIIGAGLNGLTAATILAQAGRKVLLLEQREEVGGLAAGTEFHPGYRSSGILFDTTGVSQQVIDQLGLTKYGLRRTSTPPSIFVSGCEGDGFLLPHDPAAAMGELESISKADARNYVEFRAFVDRLTPFAHRLFSEAPPNWLGEGFDNWPALLATGWSLRRLGKQDVMELLRLAPMCVADWLDEYFESPLLKAALALPALHGYWGGPRSPGTNGAFLRHTTLAQTGIAGGPGAIVNALHAAAQTAGVEIRTSARVTGIDVEHGSVSGVVCDDQLIPTGAVLSGCDPRRTFLESVGPGKLDPSFERSIREFRMRGLSAQVNLALSKPLRFKSRPDFEVEYARTAQSLTHLEKSFDEAKYGRFSRTPPLDMHVVSVSNPRCAPEGHASMSILLHGVPFELDGGWDEAKKDELGDAVVATLGVHVDGLESSLVARQVVSPLDIADEYGLTGGHLYHGEHGLDQLLVRPARQCARYATPIQGLYLCGAGTHPGGGLTCLPGFIAARTVLNNRR